MAPRLPTWLPRRPAVVAPAPPGPRRRGGGGLARRARPRRAAVLPREPVLARRRITPGREPRDATRRELREELGLLVGPDELVLAREMVVDWDYRREHVRVFELRLRAEPVLRIDNREVVAARFVAPRALLAEAVLPPFIRTYLGEQRSGHQRPPTGA